MPEKRHIKIVGRLIEDNQKVSVVIMEQSHIQSSFGNMHNYPHKFMYKDTYLISAGYPAYYRHLPHNFYLRGRDSQNNIDEFRVSLGAWSELCKAVEAYNAYFNGED